MQITDSCSPKIIGKNVLSEWECLIQSIKCCSLLSEILKASMPFHGCTITSNGNILYVLIIKKQSCL